MRVYVLAAAAAMAIGSMGAMATADRPTQPQRATYSAVLYGPALPVELQAVDAALDAAAPAASAPNRMALIGLMSLLATEPGAIVF